VKVFGVNAKVVNYCRFGGDSLTSADSAGVSPPCTAWCVRDAAKTIPYCCSEEVSSSLTVRARTVDEHTIECDAPPMPLRSKLKGRVPQIDAAFPIFLGRTDKVFYDSLLVFMYSK
jgi:hypothetical protein